MKKLKKILIIVLTVILIMCTGFAFYAADYYKAQNTYDYITSEGSIITAGDEISDTGIIFYPGAKVEYTAYAPLMKVCADEGYFTACIKMPFNFAFFNMDGADRVVAKHPEIKRWYIAGHSLGGAMAGSYLGYNAEKYEGLILLAAFTTADISDSGLKVLSIYGSQDKVLNVESYERNCRNLPDNYEEVVIEGGCHGYFGDYGNQKGDGKPYISREEQINITGEEIRRFIDGE